MSVITRCDLCDAVVIRKPGEFVRCAKCRTRRVPGWDDWGAKLPQDQDEGGALAGIAFGFVVVLVLGSAALAIWLVCRGAS